MHCFYYSHGNKEVFSCTGIKLAVDWFRQRGHKEIIAFVPQWRKETPRPETPIKGSSFVTFNILVHAFVMLLKTHDSFYQGQKERCLGNCGLMFTGDKTLSPTLHCYVKINCFQKAKINQKFT